MNSHRLILRLLLLSGWIAFQAIGATSAQASCGDYLIGTQHSRSTSRVTHDLWDLSGDNGQQHLPQVPQPKHRCHGPNCQKSPRTPIAPVPATKIVLDQDQLGCLSAALILQRTGTAFFLPSENIVRSIGFPTLIDHPPRA